MRKARQIIGMIFIAPVFVVLAFITMVLGGLLHLLRLERASEKTVHFILSFLIAWIFLWFGIKLHVTGKENIPRWGERVCYVPNHQSIIDIPVLYASGMWCGLVAKKELFKIPVLHGLLRVLKCVAIDRSSLRESLKSIIEGSDKIKKGYPMGIFPEGTRSKTGEIAEMKAGAFKMATRAKAKIVPVAMKNTRMAFEAADSLRPVHVYVKIMPAIDTEGMDEEELKSVHSIVEKEVREAFASIPGPYERA